MVLVNDLQVDQIAQAIHDSYLAEQSRDGVAMGSTPAMVVWERLDEDKREANRAQARDITDKLRRIGCRVGRGPAVRAFAFTEAELDALAHDEQLRWSSQRTEAGWRYGSWRDDDVKIHPCLVPGDELPEVEKDKDRDAVRNIPTVLAAAGLRIVRRRRTERG